MQNNPPGFKKFKKTPLFISVILLIFSCSVFLFLYKKIGDNKKIAEETQTKWQIEATRRDEIRSLERSIKDIDEERNLLESHFAQSSNVVPFLDTIEQLALEAKARSEITSVDILKNKKGLSVMVKASGSFESIYKFLTLLENSPYELEFVSANIQNLSARTVSDKKGIVPQWEAVFNIQLLSFVQ